MLNLIKSHLNTAKSNQTKSKKHQKSGDIIILNIRIVISNHKEGLLFVTKNYLVVSRMGMPSEM